MRNRFRPFVAWCCVCSMIASLTASPLAQSAGRSEEVFADIGNLRATGNVAPGPKYWCDVAVAVTVWPLGAYNVLDVQRLLQQVGAYLEKECPRALRLWASGLDGQGREAWRRYNITKLRGWHLEVDSEDLILAAGKDFSKAFRTDTNVLRAQLTAKAEAGDARAQYALGLFLQYSAHDAQRRFAPDYSAAARWFQKAADQQLPDANYALASLYRTGLGVSMNDRMVGQLLDEAVKLGHARAMVDLADWYLDEGLMFLHQAVPLYQRAADAGHPEGFRGLGTLYHNGPNSNGVGLPKDYSRAMELYRKAAAGGSCAALMHIGGLYFNGEGVTQDGPEAARWFAQAASCPAASEGTRLQAAAYEKKALGGRLPRPEARVKVDEGVPLRTLLLAGAVIGLGLFLLNPNSGSSGTGSPDRTGPEPFKPIKPICFPSALMTPMEQAVQSMFSGGDCLP